MTFIVVATLAYLGLAVLGWGGLANFFSHHPYRTHGVLAVLAGASYFAGGNIARRTRGSRQPLGSHSITLLGLLERLSAGLHRPQGVLDLDRDTLRWFGRPSSSPSECPAVWPVFVLEIGSAAGRNPARSHPGHHRALHVIRNPSLLGLLVNSLG